MESANSESRSRVSEPNPSTMSLSSRVQGIPALIAENGNGGVHHQNGSVVLSIGSGSGGPSQTIQFEVAQQQVDQPTSNELVGGGFASAMYLPCECPSVDVVCFQEVSAQRANDIVVKRLQSAFPYIIHSCKRFHGFKSCPVTTGNLVLASKFPILTARYHEEITTFGKRCLLVTKLLLHNVGDQRTVAIVGNVYVKRKSESTMLSPTDFDELVQWLRCFRTDAINMEVNDSLGLDICCGYIDMPDDGALVNEIQQHEFFRSYLSPPMHTPAGEGLFGAELEPAVLYDHEVNQPDSLHRTLFRYHPNGPHLSQLFKKLSDTDGETAPFSLLRSSFLRFCKDTTDTSPEHRIQRSLNQSRGGVTTAFAGLTTHLGLTATFNSQL